MGTKQHKVASCPVEPGCFALSKKSRYIPMKRFMIHFLGWLEDNPPFKYILGPLVIAFLFGFIWGNIDIHLYPGRVQTIINMVMVFIIFLQFIIIGFVFIVRKEVPVFMFLVQGKFAILYGSILVLIGGGIIIWGFILHLPELIKP
jgi:hypothetical protein